MTEARPDMSKTSVQELITIHAVSDGPGTKGWVHTHGLAKYGLPELEIRAIPLFLAPSAAVLLNVLAEYLLTSEKEVKLGESIQVDQQVVICLAKLDPINHTHYECERWAVVDAIEGACDFCEGSGV